MESRLIPINAWMALHRGEGGWPAELAKQGFRIHRLEAPITTSEGRVVVDGISVSDEKQGVVPTECKAGNNIEKEQAERYAAMTATDIARQAGLPFDPALAEVAPAYACLDATGIVVDLDRLKLPFAVLSVADDSVTLNVRGNTLLSAFTKPVPSPPPRYIVLDVDSPDEEFVEYLLPELVAAASRGEEYVSLESITKAVAPQYWDVYGDPTRRRLIQRARDALARAISREFPNDFRFESMRSARGGVVIRIVNTPAAFDPRGRTQSWQRLQRQTAAAVGRAAPSRRAAPGQQVLFEELGLGIELGD